MTLLATSPRLLALRLRDWLAERLLATSLRLETKRLLLGMTLGLVSHDAQGRALRQSFARGGVAHLLAVSGFHLAVVVGAVALLLGALPKLRRRERWRWALLLVVAWAFTLISGCSVPTLRASGMLTLYAGGRILRRPTSFTEVLALPAFIQLACSPLSLFSASFLLTYLALVSIRLFYRPIWGMLGKLQHPLMRYLWGCLALSLAVQPLLFPLSLYLFGTSSLAYLWTTLLVLPLATLLIPVGLLLMLVLSLGCVPPMPILGLMDQGVSLLYEGVAWAEGLPLLQVHLPLSLPMLVGYYALLALLFLLSSALRDKPTPIALPV
jgi:ComEC/Rec2-like protein